MLLVLSFTVALEGLLSYATMYSLMLPHLTQRHKVAQSSMMPLLLAPFQIRSAAHRFVRAQQLNGLFRRLRLLYDTQIPLRDEASVDRIVHPLDEVIVICHQPVSLLVH